MESFKEYKDLNAMTLSKAMVSKSGINPVIKKDMPKLKTDLAALRARLDGKKPDEKVQKEEKDSRLAKAGVSGFNKAKKTPGHKTKSHIVVAKQGDKVKTIRFGQQGVSGSPKKEGESKSDKTRRESFKARHADNIAKGKMSAAYWANKVKW